MFESARMELSFEIDGDEVRAKVDRVMGVPSQELLLGVLIFHLVHSTMRG